MIKRVKKKKLIMMIASNYSPFRVRQQDSDTKIKE